MAFRFSILGYDIYVGKLDCTEIDFVATRKEEKIYNYPKYVLRMDETAGGNYEGIKTMHVADFLLSREY